MKRQKILLGIGIPEFEKEIKRVFNDEDANNIKKFQVLDDVIIYSEPEHIFTKINSNDPDIIILKESLGSNDNMMAIIYTIVKNYNIRIIFLAKRREVGDKLLATLTTYSVHDILSEEEIDIGDIVEIVNNPRTIKDTIKYLPKPKNNDDYDVLLFDDNEEPIKQTKHKQINKSAYGKIQGKQIIGEDIIVEKTKKDNSEIKKYQKELKDLQLEVKELTKDSKNKETYSKKLLLALKEEKKKQKQLAELVKKVQVSYKDMEAKQKEQINYISSLEEEKEEMLLEIEKLNKRQEQTIDMSGDEKLNILSEEINILKASNKELQNKYKKLLITEKNLKAKLKEQLYKVKDLETKLSERPKEVEVVDNSVKLEEVNKPSKKKNKEEVKATRNSKLGLGIFKNTEDNKPASKTKIKVKDKGSQEIISFHSAKNGLGSTSTSFNAAIELAKQGLKVLYIELDTDKSSVPLWYGISKKTVGLEHALKSITSNDYASVNKTIIKNEELSKLETDPNLQDIHRRLPKTLDYLFFTDEYEALLTSKNINTKSLQQLLFYLSHQLKYNYVVVDMSSNLSRSLVESVFLLASKNIVLLEQDLSSITSFLALINDLYNKDIMNKEKFIFLVNRFSNKADLNIRDIEEMTDEEMIVLEDIRVDMLNSLFEGKLVYSETNNQNYKKNFANLVNLI